MAAAGTKVTYTRSEGHKSRDVVCAADWLTFRRRGILRSGPAFPLAKAKDEAWTGRVEVEVEV